MQSFQISPHRVSYVVIVPSALTGVYFDSCVRQIKFVDFCGKYRLPLMHYLCSPECSSPCSSASQSSTSQSESDSEDEASVAARRMQKVLLG